MIYRITQAKSHSYCLSTISRDPHYSPALFSVELPAFALCLCEKLTIAPSPIVIPAPVWPLQSQWAPWEESTNHLVQCILSNYWRSFRDLVPFKYFRIRFTFPQSSSSGFFTLVERNPTAVRMSRLALVQNNNNWATVLWNIIAWSSSSNFPFSRILNRCSAVMCFLWFVEIYLVCCRCMVALTRLALPFLCNPYPCRGTLFFYLVETWHHPRRFYWDISEASYFLLGSCVRPIHHPHENKGMLLTIIRVFIENTRIKRVHNKSIVLEFLSKLFIKQQSTPKQPIKTFVQLYV